MKKKVLSLLLVAMMGLSMLVGCGGGNEQTGGDTQATGPVDITLTVWAPDNQLKMDTNSDVYDGVLIKQMETFAELNKDKWNITWEYAAAVAFAEYLANTENQILRYELSAQVPADETAAAGIEGTTLAVIYTEQVNNYTVIQPSNSNFSKNYWSSMGALIDGASKWETFKYITLPMSKPIITYTLLTAFMGPWTDYVFAKVIMGQDTKYYTIAIGLWTMLEKEYINTYYTQFYAGCVIISIPIAILFLMTQKCYVEGVSGAVKG